MQSFQEALERGEASHLMPVFNSKEKIARGEIRPEDVPVRECSSSSSSSSSNNNTTNLLSEKI
jgi:hypothetical protein